MSFTHCPLLVLLLIPIEGWTVCQLSVVDASPSSSGCLTSTSFVLLSRLERGQPPLVFHLPLASQISMY